MSGGSGGGGRSGRSGGGGGEAAETWPGNGNGQPRPGDSKLTSLFRAEYETNPNIRVTVEQGRGGTQTILYHSMGKAVVTDHGMSVTGNNGKRYSYGENRLVDGLKHFESLGGPKNLWK